jgi:hypothetical protein
MMADAFAQPAKFVCDTPQGKRVEQGDVYRLDGSPIRRATDGFEWSEDGFANVQPTVVIDGDRFLVT